MKKIFVAFLAILLSTLGTNAVNAKGKTTAKATTSTTVTICHVPPGNPLNSHTISIGEKALGAHLAHGDIPDACDSGGPPTVPNMFIAAHPEWADGMDDIYWNPESFTELYPTSPVDMPFERRAVPACEDGTTPESRTCATGEPISCTDGTRPMYYYRPGTNGRWIMHIQNGGIICMVDYGVDDISEQTLNCWAAYNRPDKASSFSSIGLPKTRTQGGIYLPNPANLFNDYNMVVLDKCVGDRNLGANTVTDYQLRDTNAVPAAHLYNTNIYFHGMRIARATIKSLLEDPATQPMEQLMIQAHSNGSMGLYLYIDSLHQYIKSLDANIEVRGLAGVMIRSSLEIEATAAADGITDYAQYYSNRGNFSNLGLHLQTATSPSNGLFASAQVYQAGRLEQRRYENWGALTPDPALGGNPILDASCLAAHAGDPAPCMDYMHVLTNHISTPLFLTPRLFDHNLVTGGLHTFTTDFDTEAQCDAGADCCHDENFAAPNDCTVIAGQPNFYAQPGTYSPEAFAVRVHDTARAFHALFATESEMAPGCTGATCDGSPLPSPAHGAFIDDTDSHNGMLDGDVMDAVIEGTPLQEYLKFWIENNIETFCVDVSGGKVANGGTGAAWGVCPG